nr:reverse transcriptase domain-containing protein [Tanacetum cinerariifolium]
IYSSTYDDMSVNQIDIIDVAREEYAQEMLGFSNNFPGGNPTSTSQPIISDSSPSLTPFEGSDFILEEIEAYLKDESISPEIDHANCDPEGDICLIEKLLNDYPFQVLLMDLKQGEVVKAKSSIEEPLELELKDLPSHLEYAYLEGANKLPVIIVKYLKVDEKEALLKVLKSYKRAIAWKIINIKGIDPRFCTFKICWELNVRSIPTSSAFFPLPVMCSHCQKKFPLLEESSHCRKKFPLTTIYSSTYDDMSVNQIDIIDVAREEYAQEMLGFSNNFPGGNPTSTSQPIISDSSPSLTPFEGSDFILEEIEAYLKDESISPEIDHANCDPEGDICLIEKLLNDYPFQVLLMDLKQGEVVKAKSSIEEPLELELKDLPSHLEYAYLEGANKLPVIIVKYLKVDEKEALLKVLKSYKRAIAWKIINIKGIDPRFCTFKICWELNVRSIPTSSAFFPLPVMCSHCQKKF